MSAAFTGIAVLSYRQHNTAGTYTLFVVNSNGSTVAVKTLAHAGGMASQKVTLNSQLTAGVYYIKLSCAGAVVSTTSITAQ